MAFVSANFSIGPITDHLFRRPLLAVVQDGENVHIRHRGNAVNDDIRQARNSELPRAFHIADAPDFREKLEHLRGLPDAGYHAPGGGFVMPGYVVANVMEIGNGLGGEINVQGRGLPTPYAPESVLNGPEPQPAPFQPWPVYKPDIQDRSKAGPQGSGDRPEPLLSQYRS